MNYDLMNVVLALIMFTLALVIREYQIGYLWFMLAFFIYFVGLARDIKEIKEELWRESQL